MAHRIPVDIISGFLGSGKTTLLNTMLQNQYKGKNIAIIENEFGEIDVDSALLPKEIEITKITGGCVCCTLKVSLIDGIRQLTERFELDRIVIETTGVAKLSDVADAVQNNTLEDIAVSAGKIAVVNPKFHNNFSSMLGGFYEDQIKSADTVYISRSDITDEKTMQQTEQSIREQNADCAIITEAAELVLRGEAAEPKHHHHEHHHEHHHHHEDADSDFESSYVDTEELQNAAELRELIDSIVEDKAPKTVFRIKGSVCIAGENTLVQWVSGELNTSIAEFRDNRLVIVSNKEK